MGFYYIGLGSKRQRILGTTILNTADLRKQKISILLIMGTGTLTKL